MQRVFFALFPDPGTRQALVAVQAALPDLPGRTRWLDGSSLHLTLAFLGARNEVQINALIAAVASLAPPPSRQRSRGWLWLPSAQRARVLALGVEADATLLTWHEAFWQCLLVTEDAMKGATEELRSRPAFLPHVTLARLQGGRPAATLPRALPPAPALTLHWAAFGLYASDGGPASRYRPLWTLPLESGQSSGQT